MAYNLTVIGQPVDGDGATAWRDNCNVQYRNSIFMDCGEKVVRFDDLDGDGANGYGHNGTMSWADRWTTDWNVYSNVNAPGNPGAFYQAQVNGKLIEMTDNVFFRNQNADAYTEANARGVFAAANNNVLIPGFDDADSPLQSIVRGAPVNKGGKVMVPVVSMDPRPKNEATTSVGTAPNDGFFTQADYRGAFAPNGAIWACNWTALDAFGFLGDACGITVVCDPANNHTGGTYTKLNASRLGAISGLESGLHLEAFDGPAGEFGYFLVSAGAGSSFAVSNGILCLDSPQGRYAPAAGSTHNSIGQFNASGVYNSTIQAQQGWDVPTQLSAPPGPGSILPGDTWYFQMWYRDGQRSNFSNALSVTFF